ncbi:Transcription regulator (contains diacylglycerol kinase catalytic domain) [Tenacibaculum sp. 190524A02b]|uniref:diacylglycerol/lipid kinase family protein n=1 Tax=Tenacibaculum vairaonense TaxID=3137860 RepID=UPI0032B2C64B
MEKTWFLIVNPNAGNGNFNKKWETIKKELKANNINYLSKKTNYYKEENELVQKAIEKGYKHFISVGGDGTLHHIVNGIMSQNYVHHSDITVAVIPIGTGNDWVKTYNISTKIAEAVNLIKKGTIIQQDVGFLQLTNTSCYFVNVAGIGYDGYVVNKLKKLKKLGSIAYLLSGIFGLLFYRNSPLSIVINNKKQQTKCLMVLFGICKYSAGGMQLTDYKDSTNGLFDITIAKNLNLIDLIKNLQKLYNGLITQHKKVTTLNTKKLLVTPTDFNTTTYIQADGELIGSGSVEVSIISNGIQFII